MAATFEETVGNSLFASSPTFGEAGIMAAFGLAGIIESLGVDESTSAALGIAGIISDCTIGIAGIISDCTIGIAGIISDCTIGIAGIISEANSAIVVLALGPCRCSFPSTVPKPVGLSGAQPEKGLIESVSTDGARPVCDGGTKIVSVNVSQSVEAFPRLNVTLYFMPSSATSCS